jgi:hypothetical protein
MLAVVSQHASGGGDAESDGKGPGADSVYERRRCGLLADIYPKTNDVALANDAQFQLGEISLSRSTLPPRASMQQDLAGARSKTYVAVLRRRQCQSAAGSLNQVQQAIGQAGATRISMLCGERSAFTSANEEKMASLDQRADQTLTPS